MSQSAIIFLIVVLCSSVNCWIINNMNIPKLTRDLNLPTDFEDNLLSAEDAVIQRFSLIYPGTKWCGAGNIADSYDDLGRERETDKCCRAHDSCEDVIEAGESKYNLTNEAFYTRLSCECDDTFHDCLRAANKRAATNIGTVYFNALGTQCFKKYYPIVGCRQRGGWLNRKCLEYIYDMNGDQIYQWFDVADY